MIEWSDFEKIDMRSGTIIEVDAFPKANNPAWKLKVDFGELGIKKSSAQITDNYTKEQLLGKQVVAVVNFPPKQIANFFSECLVLGIADVNGNIVLLQPDREISNGEKVS
ncbi:MAG: tRNA-binding protein [Vicingaceae bacterium]